MATEYKLSYTASEIDAKLSKIDTLAEKSEIPEVPIQSVNGKIGAITVNEVPSCNASNEGQFLRVVNGVAAWSSIPNAEEVSF